MGSIDARRGTQQPRRTVHGLPLSFLRSLGEIHASDPEADQAALDRAEVKRQRRRERNLAHRQPGPR